MKLNENRNSQQIAGKPAPVPKQNLLSCHSQYYRLKKSNTLPNGASRLTTQREKNAATATEAWHRRQQPTQAALGK